MHGEEQLIRASWRRLTTGADALARLRPDPQHAALADEAIDDVLARHREPHRRYHTVTHVAWVLHTVDRLAAAIPVPSVPVLHAAALYHDAVYDPRAADNEARSADLAAEVGGRLGWTRVDIDEVHRLIRLTEGHEVEPDDVAGAVLLDADLGVLGAEPAVYAAYATGVRREYAHVDDATWRVGRSAVMRTFLDREHIYATDVMRDERERRARANIAAEIATLRVGE